MEWNLFCNEQFYSDWGVKIRSYVKIIEYLTKKKALHNSCITRIEPCISLNWRQHYWQKVGLIMQHSWFCVLCNPSCFLSTCCYLQCVLLQSLVSILSLSVLSQLGLTLPLSFLCLILRQWSMDSPTSPALWATVPPCSCWPSAPAPGPLNCILHRTCV